MTHSHDYLAKRALSASCFEQTAKTYSLCHVQLAFFLIVEKLSIVVNVYVTVILLYLNFNEGTVTDCHLFTVVYRRYSALLFPR